MPTLGTLAPRASAVPGITGRHPESRVVLRWIFVRGPDAVTCELRMNVHRTYDVSVVPRRDASSSILERYDRLAPALCRHAEFARACEEAGWTLIRATTQETAVPTAPRCR